MLKVLNSAQIYISNFFLIGEKNIWESILKMWKKDGFKRWEGGGIKRWSGNMYEIVLYGRAVIYGEGGNKRWEGGNIWWDWCYI